MKVRELLAKATVPGGEELSLFRRDGDFMIVLGRNELMNSRMSGSEEALATLTIERLAGRRAPHLLIGGYGMGFTLRAALAALPPAARLTVVEIVPEIIGWARGPMAGLTAGCLDDRRVSLVQEDVAASIRQASGTYDAILLDVDNGPDGLSRAGNDALYSAGGLAAATAALKPGGILAIWSAADDPVFARRLGQAGFRVEELAVRARSNGKGPRHIIWFASRR
jgi:spermidine synthase